MAYDPAYWIDEAYPIPTLRLAPLTPVIAYRSTALPEPLDDNPADQILVATARETNSTVISKHERIRKYPHVRTLC